MATAKPEPKKPGLKLDKLKAAAESASAKPTPAAKTAPAAKKATAAKTAPAAKTAAPKAPAEKIPIFKADTIRKVAAENGTKIADKASTAAPKAAEAAAKAAEAAPKAAENANKASSLLGRVKEAASGAANTVKAAASQSLDSAKKDLRALRSAPLAQIKRMADAVPGGRAAKLAIGATAGAIALAGLSGDSNAKGNEAPNGNASTTPNSDAVDRIPGPTPYRPAETGGMAAGSASSSKNAAADKKASAPSDKKSGDTKYPSYSKDSSAAADFRAAFAAARKEGKGEFSWQGRKYNTKLKGE